MENSIKFDIKYDYSIALVFSEHSEMLIGGSEKIMMKAFKNSSFPNLNTKGLDIYYREKPIGTLAADINQSALDAEKVQNLVDKLYANLLDKRTNNAKIADTKISLDALFRADRSVAIRVLARTISLWYDAVTDLYMNGKFGIPLKQTERTALGEQFRDDVSTLIETFFTVLKKKISPQNNAKIREIIRFNCTGIQEFLAEYSRYLSSNSVFCIHCKLCGGYFISGSWNTRYCDGCKKLRKQNSKKIYAEKCSEGVHKMRQTIKFRFENFIHKNRLWDTLSDDDKAEYNTLRKEFVTTSASMLRDYEQKGEADQERAIRQYLKEADNERATIESKFNNRYVFRHKSPANRSDRR